MIYILFTIGGMIMIWGKPTIFIWSLIGGICFGLIILKLRPSIKRIYWKIKNRLEYGRWMSDTSDSSESSTSWSAEQYEPSLDTETDSSQSDSISSQLYDWENEDIEPTEAEKILLKVADNQRLYHIMYNYQGEHCSGVYTYSTITDLKPSYWLEEKRKKFINGNITILSIEKTTKKEIGKTRKSDN